MATTRRKTAKIAAPATLPDAIGRIVRYVAIDTEIERLALDAKEAIAKLKAVHDEQAKPLAMELKGILAELGTWWAVAGDELTDGEAKSTKLAGVTLGLRMTPPRLKVKGSEGDAIAALIEAGLAQFVRFDPSLDKPVIHAALKTPDADDPRAVEQLALGERLRGLGLETVQREEFFIARPETLPAVETVASVREAA